MKNDIKQDKNEQAERSVQGGKNRRWRMNIFFLSFLFSLFIFCACRDKQATQGGSAPLTKVEWVKKNWNFGEITAGEIVSHTFFFKNTGEENFIIKNTESGCGCTTVAYDKSPLSSGKEGKIEITFNSEGRYGKQYKEISIFANVPEKKITLSFTANVKE